MKIRVFVELSGAWLPIGEAHVEVMEGRQVLRLELAAVPVGGRLCVALADLDVLRQEAVAGNA